MKNYLSFLVENLEDEWDKEITLKRNDFLINKGDLNTNLYLVKEGSLRVFIEDDNEEHTIRFGYKKSIITAFDCFLTEKPTFFYIQALKKCELKVISKINYMRFINSKKEYQDVWNVFLNDFMYQQIEREIDLITYSPQKRFNRVFKRSPQLFQEIPQKYIASYLRMAPETLSRILKNLD
ncbi:Crp/Fnr family transcriptional regulator [Tenacibaculum finnmarkense]|uniref:Crp/Fnr family transcriptional regulator n=1 Tax=Tenacibaculum finnmarkense TaxID=2781243 RepID=UPI001EFA80D8|nr:Crp/Fnr family transcriptional regulator [Tenacibaculum finnmarkense]MCG8207295.1 Crp/Fnr family transcriptional regulator [Tenacibaculum finnmarkense genomovar finnmarkense]MCG8723466.1 Crp/Fnr family transcriptional regulator [Tenacibaculum finnmarkense]MCG8741883.1 Crp/Fnr family transcriptional regulator [Tenacibaculum finnmarkense]MCG8765130.1 Crp/Fnr family transcriptional regulator [Tenacibaculum finnmarkense]MCG8777971.1 Crp/Fnr family transcriptional regulator [Tenacibaculum finnma